MSKETDWLRRRCGMITASELGELTSTSGRIIDGTLTYIRKKRWERLHGFAHPVSARAMEIGNEVEPQIIAWCRENLVFPEIIYSKEQEEIPLWWAPDCPLGASPDAYIPDESVVIEAKTLVGNTAIEFFDDKYTAYEEKKAAVWKDHGDQLLGQFLSNPKVQEIQLVKYIYCDDDIMSDTDSPLAPWRGNIFVFRREDYTESIAAMRERIILIDKMIDAPINPSKFKEGRWYVDADGQLKQELK